MNAKDGTLRKEQIYADARHPLKTAKDKTKGITGGADYRRRGEYQVKY